ETDGTGIVEPHGPGQTRTGIPPAVGFGRVVNLDYGFVRLARMHGGVLDEYAIAVTAAHRGHPDAVEGDRRRTADPPYEPPVTPRSRSSTVQPSAKSLSVMRCSPFCRRLGAPRGRAARPACACRCSGRR